MAYLTGSGAWRSPAEVCPTLATWDDLIQDAEGESWIWDHVCMHCAPLPYLWQHNGTSDALELIINFMMVLLCITHIRPSKIAPEFHWVLRQLVMPQWAKFEHFPTFQCKTGCAFSRRNLQRLDWTQRDPSFQKGFSEPYLEISGIKNMLIY